MPGPASGSPRYQGQHPAGPAHPRSKYANIQNHPPRAKPKPQSCASYWAARTAQISAPYNRPRVGNLIRCERALAGSGKLVTLLIGQKQPTPAAQRYTVLLAVQGVADDTIDHRH
jgi:hypothetical protein